MRKIGIVAVLLFAIIPFFLAHFVSAYTSPGKPTGFVNDFASIISADEKSKLETVLSNLQNQTGNEITIVTIPTLGDETVETYTVRLFEEWGIGEKGKDNGLLLLVALQEKKMRIEVGYGLEGYITDAQASSIIRNILTPAFKEGDYTRGISRSVDIMIKVLNGQVDAFPPETIEDKGSFADWFLILLLAPIWLASILGRSKSWWLGGVLGLIAGIFIGGILWIAGLAIVGLIFDFIVSKAYAVTVGKGKTPPWWIGGGGFGGRGGGGGFGGFGGGGSGGGGSSGGW